MKPSRRRALLVATALILMIGIGGVASAFWAGPGGGSGSVDTATVQPVTLSPGTPTAQLYPGGSSTVLLSIANPNAASVRVPSLVLDTSQGAAGFAVDGGHAGCALSSLGYAAQTNGGAGWTVAGGGNLSVSLAGSLSMSATASSSCQSASFTVYLSAGP